MILSNKRITKALIRLRVCAGWSAPVLFANPEDRFTHVEAQLCHGSILCCFYTDGCSDTPLDLVFVLDSSHSIWIPHFRRELNFVNDVLTSFDIGPTENQTHVALLTFGHTVWPQFYFNTYKRKFILTSQ